MNATAPDFTANAAQSAETMLRNANQQIFGLQAENRELRIALTEAAQTMRNLSHLSAKYRTMLASKEPRA